MQRGAQKSTRITLNWGVRSGSGMIGSMFPTEAVPERIGAYKVLRRLAGAGSADVYVGRMEGPRGFSRLCTLKLVPSTIEGDETFAAELEREAAICATLSHPAIQRVFDFFEHEKHLVLVLEHVEGTSLDRLLAQMSRRQKKLSDAAIAALGRELAGALAHAHAVKDDDRKPTPVIHRNLTPENVLIGWDGQVRLTGFGLGKILGRTPDTVIGVIKGAPGFMAPEQSRGDRVTPKADVYALGLLLWSLFSGQKPPEDGTREPPLVMLRPDLFKPLALAIDRALEPVPDKRGVSCQEIEALLGKVPGADKGREEIAEKALLLRGSRTATSESETRPKVTTGPTRTPTPRPQRRVSLAQVRPGKPSSSSNKKLSVPPPASRPSAERPSQRPTPPSMLLDAEGPESVFPILRALAEHVPKPGAAIPGPPRLPAAKAPDNPPGNRPGNPRTPPPAPVKPAEKPRTVTPIGIGLSAPNEWKESVPDEDALDRFFDDAGFETSTPAPATTAPIKAAPTKTAPTTNENERISQPPRSNRKNQAAGRRMELDDTIPGMALVPEEEPAPPNPRPEAKPLPRLTPTPPVATAATAAPQTPPPMTAASVFTSPTPPPVRFGAPPKAVAQTPIPQAVAPPNPVRFGPPPGATGTAAPETNLRVTTQLAPRPYGGKTKSLKPTAASLAVVGGIACMVTAAIVMIVGRPPAETAPDAAVSTTAPPPPPPPPSPTPTTPKAAPPPPPPPAGSGYLTVEFPGEGVVYVSGRKLGRTNQMLVVPCGSKFVRVATTAEGRYPEWLSPGETVDVPCLGSTKFSTSTNAPKPLPPRKR